LHGKIDFFFILSLFFAKLKKKRVSHASKKMEVSMKIENLDFDSNEPMTVKEAAKELGFSTSLLYTIDMKIALGAYIGGKRGIRFKKGCVMRMKYGESIINLKSEQKNIIKSRSIKIESQLGLW